MYIRKQNKSFVIYVPGVTAEQQNMGVLILMTGVAMGGDLQVVEDTMGANFGQGSML